jgi:chaperonin GroES|tara:strand:+ start:255 stop:554 length:300 start_codon:yes stop_codon:yes gene_type:complete
MTEIVPLRNFLVVKKINDENRTKSGLQLSDDTKERPTKGTVLEVGAGRMNDDGKTLPMVVKKGDTILYPKYSGHPAKVNNQEYLILGEDEVLAILKETV